MYLIKHTVNMTLHHFASRTFYLQQNILFNNCH